MAYRKEIHIGVRTIRDWQSGDRRQASWVLLLAVLAVLMLACMNIASLLLARATSRQRELAMRQALGASRSRLARHAITESLLLGICGGALGCVLSFFLLKSIARHRSQQHPRTHRSPLLRAHLRVRRAALSAERPDLRSASGFSTTYYGDLHRMARHLARENLNPRCAGHLPNRRIARSC